MLEIHDRPTPPVTCTRTHTQTRRAIPVDMIGEEGGSAGQMRRRRGRTGRQEAYPSFVPRKDRPGRAGSKDRQSIGGSLSSKRNPRVYSIGRHITDLDI